MAATPEAKVKAKVRQRCGALNIKINTVVMSGYGKSGQLDMYGLYRGRYIGIETKATAKDKPTPLQQLELDDIVAHGGVGLVIHIDNLDRLDEFVASVDGMHAVLDRCLSPTNLP
jgi:hypothetical protein